MPENLENRFLEEVRKRKQKQRKRTIRKFAAFFLIFCLLISLVYLFHQGNTILKIGNLAISTILLGIVGLILIISLVVYFVKNQTSKHSHKSLVFSLKILKNPNLSNIQWKYGLGATLILLTFICQANQSIINNYIHTWIYQPQPPKSNQYWPWKDYGSIDPIVTNIPPDVEKSIKSVAEYIAQKKTDPYLQVKALHDYVISRVSYDLDVLKTGRRPPQDADTVFKTHKAVCEGYAKLFTALGNSIGLDVVYLTGKVRRDLVPQDVVPNKFNTSKFISDQYDWTLHAWNAVKISDEWQLIDVTWDDRVPERHGVSYSTDYLTPPPEAMIISHLPDQPIWQLLKHPQDKDKFEEQLLLKPGFFAEKLEITSPKKYESSVKKTASIKIKSPLNYKKQILAIFTKQTKTNSSDRQSTQGKKRKLQRCQSQQNGVGKTQISCKFPEKGDYQVFLYAATGQKTIHIGEFKFHAL